MVKKFVAKEIWLLGENGNKAMKLIPFDSNEAFTDCVDHESIRGGLGNVEKRECPQRSL